MQNRIVVTVLSLLLVLCTGVTGCSAKSAEETKKVVRKKRRKSRKKQKNRKRQKDLTKPDLDSIPTVHGEWILRVLTINQKRLPMMDMRMEQEKRPVQIRQVRLLMTIRWISMESLLNGKEILLKLKMRRMC